MEQIKRIHHRLRWPLRILGAGFMLILILLVFARWWITTEPGHRFIETQIEASAPSGVTLDVSGLRGDPLREFIIARLQAEDSDGIWLDVEDISANWSPWALLGRKLSIEAFSIERVAFRKPTLPASDSSDSSDAEFPLRRLNLDQIDIALIEYIGNETETISSASLSGHARYEDGAFDVAMDFVPLDGPEDRAMIRASREAQSLIQADINIVGAPNGWLARLAGLPSTDDLEIEMTANGEADSWQLDGLMTVSGDTVLDVSGSSSGNGLALVASVKNTLPWLPAEIANRIHETVNLDLQLADSLDSTYELTSTLLSGNDQLRLGTNAVYADGAIELTDIDLALALTETSKLLSGTGLSLGSANLKGNALYGDANTYSLDVTLDVRDLSTEAARFDALSGPVSLVQADGDLELDISPRFSGLTQRDGVPFPLIGASPAITLNVRLPDAETGPNIQQLSLTGDAITLSARQRGDALAGTYRAALAELDLGDASTASGTFAVSQRTDTILDASLTGTLDQLRFPDTSTDLAPINLAIMGSVSDTGLVDLDRLSLTHEFGTLEASGAYSETSNLTLSATLSVNETTTPSLSLPTGATANLSLNGPLNGFAVSAALMLDEIGLSDTTLAQTRLALQGTGSPSALSGTLTAVSQTDFGPFSLTAVPKVSTTDWATGAISAALGGLSAEGSAEGEVATPENLAAQLFISGTHTDLPIDQLELALSYEQNAIRADGTFETATLGPLSNTKAAFSAEGDDLGAVNSTLKITADHVLYGQTNPILLDLEMTSDITTKHAEIGLKGNYAEEPFRTPVPLLIDLDQPFPVLSGTLRTLRGLVSVEPIPSASRTAGRITIEQISLGRLTELIDTAPIAGQLSSVLDFDLAETSQSFYLTGRIDSLSADQTDLDVITADFEAALDPQDLSARFHLASADADMRLTLSGQTDWHTGLPDLRPGTPLNLSLVGNGAIAPFAAFILPPEMALSGTINANLTTALNGSDTTGMGTITLTKGRFEHGDLGLVLTDLALNTELQGDRLSLKQLDAQSAGGGSLSGSGHVSLIGSDDNEMRLTLHDLLVVDRIDGRARLSGALAYAREEGGNFLSGELNIDRANIDLNRLVGSAKPTLPIRFEGDPPPAQAPAAQTELRIDINAPGRIFAEGQGIDAELGASARIRGDLNTPVISADATILRGDYSFAGQSFNLIDSEITLPAGSDEAVLDVKAERQTSDFTATIIITGTQSRPIIALSSDPFLPESEILSRILFGLSPTELSPVQAARLASALASLTGGSGFDVLGRLENVLQLDRLDLSETEDGTAIITTGKYIRPNVYVQAENRVDGSVGVAIDWEPFDAVTVRGETDPDNGQELSILWRRDFDSIRKNSQPEDAPQP